MMVGAASALLRVVEPSERRLVILVYHRVLSEPDPLVPSEVTAAVFKWQMDVLSRYMQPLPLREALLRLADGTLPRRAVAVTFDDGYADNRTIAADILLACGVPATFFVATGFLDGGRMWNDTVLEAIRQLKDGEHDLGWSGLGSRMVRGDAGRRALFRDVVATIKHLPQERRELAANRLAAQSAAELPDDLMLTSRQVRELAELGFEIGGHTVTHPILSVLGREEATREILSGRERLEQLVGPRVKLFAYPNGRPGEDFSGREVELVREAGFEAAVSTRRGSCGPGSDPWQLARYSNWERTPERWLTRLLLCYREVV